MKDNLTATEKKVVQYIPIGATNKQIARILGTTEGVIDNYMGSIYSKYGIELPAGAARAKLAAILMNERLLCDHK